MTTFNQLAPASSDPPEPFTGRLRLAVAAYLARFKGSSREHTESDLRCYLAWCAERGLDPLAAKRPHLELYIRSMQEIRRFKPSTISRRFSVAAGFYRTCVLDGIMEHSPAEHVRRPRSPRRVACGYGKRTLAGSLVMRRSVRSTHGLRRRSRRSYQAPDRPRP